MNGKAREQAGGRGQQGVTLVELMIVVVIIAILGAIALPAYQNYTREARRADGHSALLRIASQQERFFSDNNSYATNVTQLGYPASPAMSQDGFWGLVITNVDANLDYTITATAGGTRGHTDPECTTITYDSRGVRGGSGAGCW